MALMLCTADAMARSPLSREEALALAYPGATITAARLFLTTQQMADVAARAGTAVATPLVARYTARKAGAEIGRAYIDTHTVRTKKESLLVSLDAARAVTRVDVVAFLEPPEYEAPSAFLRQFSGRPLTDDLRLQRAIRPIAGASLTAHAVTDAVRRVLAIDAVLTAGVPPREDRP